MSAPRGRGRGALKAEKAAAAARQNLRRCQGARHVLLVGEDAQRGILELVLVQHREKLVFTRADALLIGAAQENCSAAPLILK